MDEALTWLAAEIGRPFGRAELLENVHGPVYVALLHAWGGVAGESEFALRLPSVLFGVLTVPAMAWLAHRWLGRDAAAPAAWLAAGSPFLVWFAQEARNYSLLILAAVASSALLLGLRERLAAGRAAAYVAAAVTGALSNFSFGFLAPLHARWWLGGGARRRGWTLAALLVATLALVPWIPSLTRTWDWSRLVPGRAVPAGEESLRGATTIHAAAVPWTLYVFAAGYTLGPSLRELRREGAARAAGRYGGHIAATAVVFGVLGAAGLRAVARRRRLGDLLLWTLPGLLLLSFMAASNFKVFHPRYLAVAFPAFLLTIAAGFTVVSGRARVALAAGVVALWSLSLVQHWFVPRFGKEDYRGAMALVGARAAPGDRLIAAGADHPVTYYNRGRLPQETLWLGFVRDPGRLDRELDRMRGDAPAWVVLSRGEDLDPARVLPARIAARFPGAERHATEGVEVWRIPAGPAAD